MGNVKPGAIVSSTRVDTAHGHDRVSVWNRGGLAGMLTVTKGDGDTLAERLENDGARFAEVVLEHRTEVARLTQERDDMRLGLVRLMAALAEARRERDEARAIVGQLRKDAALAHITYPDHAFPWLTTEGRDGV